MTYAFRLGTIWAETNDRGKHMKLGLQVSPACIEWLHQAAMLAGMRKSQLVERIVQYYAGELTADQQAFLEHMLEMCSEKISVDWGDGAE